MEKALTAPNNEYRSQVGPNSQRNKVDIKCEDRDIIRKSTALQAICKIDMRNKTLENRHATEVSIKRLVIPWVGNPLAQT